MKACTTRFSLVRFVALVLKESRMTQRERSAAMPRHRNAARRDARLGRADLARQERVLRRRALAQLPVARCSARKHARFSLRVDADGYGLDSSLESDQAEAATADIHECEPYLPFFGIGAYSAEQIASAMKAAADAWNGAEFETSTGTIRFVTFPGYEWAPDARSGRRLR
jgi:hypothetical protein